MRFYIWGFIFILFPLTIFSQKDSLRTINLKPVVVKTTRILQQEIRTPAAITSLNFNEYQDNGQQLSFNEYLLNIPGVFALNSNNFSQDLRISIRGFGARSAFGIRGVKIVVDGIPETTPDGQGQIDNLNLSIINNIEVLRGPASFLYGNASGGVVNINTIDFLDESFVKFGLTLGSYNMYQSQATVGLKKEKTSYIFHGNNIKTDGYRNESGFNNYSFNFRALHQISESQKMNFLLNYTDSPMANDAGGLTLEEVNEDRRQARQRNIDFNTGEEINQLKIGVGYNLKWTNLNLNSYAFYSFRNFYGLLPFEFGGVVDLKRNYFGNGTNLTYTINQDKFNNKLQIGYDFSFQKDNRSRFSNQEGIVGAKTLEQDESFNAYGVYLLDHLSLGNLLIRTGLRYDHNVLKVDDDFPSNGVDSDNISLNSISTSLGLNLKIDSQNYVYTNFSTSFETPTLSELSANPIAEGGFNTNLEPQKANNFELGYKRKSSKDQLGISLFYIKTNDDLVPFELENFPDRTFFQNAGSTKRKGIELFYKRSIFKNTSLIASYTFSDFEYSSFEIPSGIFNGNQLPGIPKHLASASLNYSNKKDLKFSFQSRYIGRLYTNNDNSIEDNAYTVHNLNASYSLKAKKITLIPFLGINNIFNEKYNDNIRINAFAGRFYEPAPEINIYGGLRVKI